MSIMIRVRSQGGQWEELEIDGLVVGPEPPEPPNPPDPPEPPEPISDQDRFMDWVDGKPFGQQTLLDLEPTMNAWGWQLTKANANGERTKVRPPNGPWVRVGFGEGHWVWTPQS